MKFWDMIRVGRTPTPSTPNTKTDNENTESKVDVSVILENDDDNCGLPPTPTVTTISESQSNFYDEPGTISINVPDDQSIVYNTKPVEITVDELRINCETGDIVDTTKAHTSIVTDSPLVDRYDDKSVVSQIVSLDANDTAIAADENNDISKLEAVDPSTISLDTNKNESQNMKDVRDRIEEDKKKDNSAPPAIANSNLNTEEVRAVQTMFIEFQKKYFEDSPMSKTIDPQFFFNLPKEVYKFATEMKAKDMPDIFNPLLLFFGLNLREADTYPIFIRTVISLISDEDCEMLDKYYDDYYDEPEYDDNDENNEGVSEVPLDE